MAEAAALAAAIAIAAALLPVVWFACDRHAAVGRLAARDSPDPESPIDFVDDIAFLMQVTRSVRAGATAAQAIVDASPPSRGVAAAQATLRKGAPLQKVLAGETPVFRTLLSCLHHGVLSVGALEHAIGLAQGEARLQSDIRTALALARRSARVLTLIPFALLALTALLSGAVRTVLLSPFVIVVVLVGAALNRAGYAWLSATARSVSTAHSTHDRLLDVASGVASHLRAGGTLASAFERLSVHDEGCATVCGRLASGESLRMSLTSLGPDLDSLSRALVACTSDGLPVAPAVDEVINDAIVRRSAEVGELIAALPARGTTPLVLLVLPSFLLLAVVPLAIAVLRGLQIPTT